MAAWRAPRRDTELLEARRWEAAELLRQGRKGAEIARRLGVSAVAVSKWRRRLYALGPAGLRSRRRSGRPPIVPPDQRARLREIIRRGAVEYGYPTRHWSLERLRQAGRTEWGVRYSRSTIHRMLREQGFHWSVEPLAPAHGRHRPLPIAPATAGRGAWVPVYRVIRRAG